MTNVTANINPSILRWAILRAGISEEPAIIAFPNLRDWLTEEKKPTVAQLEKFAKKFHVPIGYLYLKEPPIEEIPFPMFRGKALDKNAFDLNVFDTIMSISNRQAWLEEYLLNNDIQTCQIAGIANLKNPISETVNILRRTLDLSPKWAFVTETVEEALNLLSSKIENAGIFLAFNGVVGNNNKRKINVDECRGFALTSQIAPYIFVNSTDSKTAQMFTLIHEVAHIMLGISAGHAGEISLIENAVEIYCDKVAAEFLVPTNVLYEIWNGDFKFASRRFKVSEIVIARKAHDLGLISDEEYRSFWFEYKQRPIKTKKVSGGDFYLTSVKRVGRLFAIHVKNAVQDRDLSYTEAYRLTGLYGRTYQQFMTSSI